MLAATQVDSAPLVPMKRCMNTAMPFDKYLHDAEVVQNCEQRANKNDNRQDLKGENDPELVVSKAKFVAKNKARSRSRITQQRVHKKADAVEQLPQFRFQDEKREAELQGDAPHQDALLNGRAAGGEKISGEDDGN